MVFYWLYEVELQVEKDKSDIEHYEKDYQAKFLDYLKTDQQKTQNSDSKSSFDSEAEDDEEEEENSESDN